MEELPQSELKYYVIDLETHGLRVNYHEITEISIIRASDKVQLSRNIKALYPERASIDALTITNKTLADLSYGDSREITVEACDKFFNEDKLTPAHRIIVGHNIYNFDRRFLHALWESVGKVFPANMWLDTIPMTRKYAKSIGLVKPKVNLHAACDIVGIKKIAAIHNAKSDSRNSYLLWQDLINNKKMDYLPFIKTAPHLPTVIEEEELDLSILEG
jgi:DNA polymerase III alpha subunit (gram-positive type)